MNDFVWASDEERDQFADFLQKGYLPHLLLVGPPGVGKTSLARMLLKQLNVEESDQLYIPASKEGTISTVRGKITQFIIGSGWGSGSSLKYIILDEADGLTHAAQDSLRTDINDFSNSVRWILTANRIGSISAPLQDRCVVFNRTTPSKDQYLTRLLEILIAEGVPVETTEEMDVVSNIAHRFYPSLRQGTNMLQLSVRDGRLKVGKSNTATTDADWQAEVLIKFAAGRVIDARKQLSASASTSEMEEYYGWLAARLDLFVDQGEAIITISDGLYQHAQVADPEINLSATLARLVKIGMVA